MPTRIIRESMLDSHRYASLGDPAKLLFVHLLLIADDFGCTSISPTFLRRRAFYNSPTNEHIAKLVAELVDADLIRCYEHEGAQLGFIPRFRQRLQRETLKHPQPPVALLHGDQHAIDKFNKINNIIQKPTVAQRIPTVGQPPEVEVEVEVEGVKGTPVVLKGSSQPKPKNHVDRATRLNVDTLPEDWQRWAIEHRPDLNPAEIFERFRDFWIAKPGKGGTKLDWAATWRNWCRNEKPGLRPGGPQVTRQSATMRSMLALERVKRRPGATEELNNAEGGEDE